MSLKIFKSGLLDTVQDLGRYGHQDLGINPGGVMDRFSAQIANMLVGNELGEPVLELHFPASIVIFNQPALIALAGADFSPTISGETIPIHHPVFINKGSILQFHNAKQGARVYLAVRGGLDIPKWLGSASTHLSAGTGGYNGRALLKDDEIGLRSRDFYFHVLQDKEHVVMPWSYHPDEINKDEIWVLPGNEWERLSTSARESFGMTEFVITRQSDRMGYRLNNIPLPSLMNGELLSSPVSGGTIQLLPDGRLIVLMADHQTTGGYPRIAHVITTHFSILAQKRAGDKLRFKFTDQGSAEKLLVKQQQHLKQLQNACTFRLESILR
jgi:antagonist of KipI